MTARSNVGGDVKIKPDVASSVLRNLMINSKQKSAFTLIEIMVTVVLIGVILAFAIPNYQKSIETSYERDAVAQLKTIQGAQFLYKTGTGTFLQTNGLTNINSLLKIGIIANGFQYNCPVGDATQFTCQAIRTDGVATPYTLEISVSGATQNGPRCSAGTCPSCNATNCL